MSKPERSLRGFILEASHPDTTIERLRNMDTAKVARFYGIPVETVEAYRAWQMGIWG